MTDSNGDIVDKVARVLWGNASFGGTFEDVDVDDKDALRSEARAVIAAVLDDLMEPTDAMILNASDALPGVPRDRRQMASRTALRLGIHARRVQLGLSSPVEPGDAARTA